MGFIRFILAIAVLFGHGSGMGFTNNILTIGFITPYLAVQCFFCISGFYISMVLHEKYNNIRIFYISRYLRIMVPYLFVLSISFIFLVTSDVLPNNKFFQHLNYAELLIPILLNIFIFFQDLASFIYLKEAVGSSYILISQGWSLGVELLFYLVAPLIVRQKSKYLLSYIVLFFCLRFIFVIKNFPFFPIQQKLCFLELTEFMAGILSHRLYMFYKNKFLSNALFKKAAAFLLSFTVFFLMTIHHYFIPLVGSNLIRDQNMILMMSGFTILIFVNVLPFIFFICKDYKLDRYVGELSYPIYLWHILVAFFIGGLYPGKFDVSILLIVTLVCAILTIYLVEKPLNRFRHKLFIKKNFINRIYVAEPLVS